MKPSESFGVFVRAVGFLVVLFGLWELWGGFENVVENLLSSADEQASSFSFFAFGIPEVVAGLLIFFLADWVVRLAYRQSAPLDTRPGARLC